MKQKPIPWTLVHSDAPKDLNNLFGTVRVYLSPDQQTIEIQVNSQGLNNVLNFNWYAWIIRVQYGKKGWEIKKDGYAISAKNLYQELFEVPEDVVDEIDLADIHYSITTYAIMKKDTYLMGLYIL